MYPTLPQSFKRRFPFRLSVPSFIYPADYVTNVQRLGAYVDEIELLLFESRVENLPSADEIERLAALALEMHITYNIHLPIDLDVGGAHPESCRQALARLAAVLERVRPLSPTTHTLHLAYKDEDHSPASIARWQARTLSAMAALLRDTAIPPGQISIETLDYPPAWFAPLVSQLDLAVCLDAGHIVRHGLDLQSTLALFSQRITICHLHGVDRGKDHLSLDKLAPEPRKILRRFLQNFRGSVSLEVFAFDRLRDSLRCMADMMDAECEAASGRR
ncbi:MAG: alanine racemase [Desulfatitalea sp.]|nr:alanine racemase [Desulfatitalea sp.]